MKRSYKSPYMWLVALVGLLFTAAGKTLLAIFPSMPFEWFAYDMFIGGLIMAGTFTLCAGANFIGTRFTINREFADWLPSRMVIALAFIAIGFLVIGVVLGADNKFLLPIITTGCAVIYLGLIVAFLIRGMAKEDFDDRPRLIIKRTAKILVMPKPGDRRQSKRNGGPRLCVNE